VSARGQLEIAAGFATRAGKRADNRDFGIVDLGTASQNVVQGIVAALASGGGASQGGRIASELAVHTFIDGYRSKLRLAGVAAAAMQALDAYNLWLHGQSRADPMLQGSATSFTAAVFLARTATIVHVGDNRAWHLRAGNLTPLTEDHAVPQAQGGRTLLRAVGLEPALRADIETQRIETQDRFMLTTKGVHDVLSARELLQLLSRRGEPQADADAIVDAAIAAGGEDNATVLVIDIVAVPAADYSVIVAAMEGLPIRPLPGVGDTIDGFKLARVLFESKIAHLFLAKDGDEWAVLKFPDPKTATDLDRTRFMREVFLGQHVVHPNVGGSLLLPEGRQSRLYVAMPYYKGETLEARLRRDGRMMVSEAIRIAIKAARGLAALHKAGVTHRDVKPQNIMLLDDGEVKLLDLGVAHLPRLEDVDESATPGTLDYMAPELFREDRGDALSDQYALGVVLYRMLAGVYPFGETPPGERPLFGPVPPLSAYRDDVPARLNAAILRTISLPRANRFANLDAFIFELERGNLPVAPRRRGPLFERNPLLFWRLLSAVLAALVVLLILIIVRR
jgi:serine/threonine protein kinase